MSTIPVERDLAQLLMPTWLALLDIEKTRSAEHALTHWHYIVLSDVHDHPGTSQTQLARRIRRSPSRVADDVEQLRSRALLKRTTAEHDRRINRVDLTEKGRALTLLVRRHIRADENQLLRRLTSTRRAQLRELLAEALAPDDR